MVLVMRGFNPRVTRNQMAEMIGVSKQLVGRILRQEGLPTGTTRTRVGRSRPGRRPPSTPQEGTHESAR